MNYFRITAYYPKNNISIIADANGIFNQLWEFSSYLIKKGFEIIAVSKSEIIKEINIDIPNEDKNNILIRAINNNKPQNIDYEIEGQIFNAIKLNDKLYIPKI